MHTLTAVGVVKRYKAGAALHPVLNGIDYTFKSGVTHAIMGVSGTGKSTLMHILAGVDTPTAGRILFDGDDLAQLTVNERQTFLNKTVGLVFQEPYLIKELTVIENVMIKGLVGGYDMSQARQRALQLLEQIGLADKAQHYPLTLSGGQQQRVAVLRAFFNQPLFLIADEPTGNLDKENAQLVLDLLNQGTAWGMGLIVSTHDPLVARLMQVQIRLERGLLVDTAL